MDYINDYNKDLNRIGQVLSDYRKYSCISRCDVEHRYGISRSLVERAERGKNITLLTLLRLCDALEVDPKNIFEEM